MRAAGLAGLLLCAAAGSATAAGYTTDFPTSENPISEGGRWVNGGVVGLDWGNAATANGFVQPRLNNGGGPSYNDSTALLTGSWGDDQAVNVTLHRGAGVVEGDYPEVEIRLRSSLAAHSCTGYEVMFSLRSDASCYVAIVRWNGAFGDFTILAQVMGTKYVTSDGAQLMASAVGSDITVSIAGQPVLTASDSTYASGAPGVGFDHNGSSADDSTFGFSSFTAMDGVAHLDMSGASVDMSGASVDMSGASVDMSGASVDMKSASGKSGGCALGGNAGSDGGLGGILVLALALALAQLGRRINPTL